MNRWTTVYAMLKIIDGPYLGPDEELWNLLPRALIGWAYLRFMRHFVLSITNAKPSNKRKSSMIGTWVNLYFFTESFLLQNVCLFKYFADGWHTFQNNSFVFPSLVRCYLQWPPGSAPPTFFRRSRPADRNIICWWYSSWFQSRTEVIIS